MRGDVITVSLSGDYGKPRPAIIIQSDVFNHLPSLTVLPLTSDLLKLEFTRVTLEPSPKNGLRLRSQVMIDKANTLPRSKAGAFIGQLDDAELGKIDRALAIFLGLV